MIARQMEGRCPVMGDGDVVSRRVVFAAFSGVLITATASAVAAAVTGWQDPAPFGGGTPGDPARTARPVARRQPAGIASRPRRAHPQAGSAPAKPVFYVDGPKTVALTIDDGPSPPYTGQVLQVLEQHRVKATFSMVGRNVARYPGVAREVAGAGHLIVNHTWSHADLAVMPAAAMRDEVNRGAAEIDAATGQRPTLFRAPYGAWSPALLRYCAAQGLTPLDWSVDPRDWARPGVAAIVQDILRTTRPGSIILEHDGGGDRSQTVAALKIVLPRLLEEGFRFRFP
jgi:peptidoglycan/xylan/chitin deacetylase (PgdA/CDA1 family)